MREGIDCKGKNWKEKIKVSSRIKDLTEQKFGYLQPLFVVEGKSGETLWLCQCNCGNQLVVDRRNLENGHSSSCGCYQKECSKNKREEHNKLLVGKRFGRLVVTSYDGRFSKNNSSYSHSYHTCQCDCGKITQIRTSHLISGKIQSCGCIRNEKFSSISSKSLIGQKFGLLTVIELIGSNERKLHMWKCTCECGGIKIIDTNSLTTGKIKSCGCINRSFGETIIQKILEEKKISYKKEYAFKDLVSENGGYLRYDFAILKNNKPIRLIEFDGEQHNSPREFFGGQEGLQKLVSNDFLKNQYASSHNIPLIRIPYSYRDKITLSLLFGDKFLVNKE